MLTKTEAKGFAATLKQRLATKAEYKRARRDITKRAIEAARSCGDEGKPTPKGKFRKIVREAIAEALDDIASADKRTFKPGFNYVPEKKACEDSSIGFYINAKGEPVIGGSWKNDVNNAMRNVDEAEGDNVDERIDAWANMDEGPQYRAAKPKASQGSDKVRVALAVDSKWQKQVLSGVAEALKGMTAKQAREALESFFSEAAKKAA